MAASCVGVMVRELVEDLVGRERIDCAVLQTEHAGHVVRDGADVVGDEANGRKSISISSEENNNGSCQSK